MGELNQFRSKKQLSHALVGGLAGLIVAAFVSRIALLGQRIPSDHLVADYFVALLWCLGIGVYVSSLPVGRQERKDLILAWCARCAVTLVAMLFYEHYYPLDAFSYYDISKFNDFNLSDMGFGHGTENTQAICWLLNHYLPILDSFHALKVFFSFVGYVACFLIYSAFAPLCGERRRQLLFLVFLYPSMIFWSSILGKDPIILLGVSLYVFGTVRFILSGNVLYLLPLTLGIGIASFIRSWYLAILVLPLAMLGFHGIKRTWMKVLFLGVIAGGAVFSAKMFAAQFNVANVNDLVDRTHYLSRSWSQGGSARMAPEFSSLGAILKFAPLGMFTALFRPLPGEVNNPFGLLAGLENFAVLAFIFRSFGKIASNKRNLSHPVTSWALMLIFVWSFLYGFISYQNLGAAVRFRLQILPVVLSLVFFLNTDASEDALDGVSPEDGHHVRHHGGV